jgi:alpha-beta hydrolase superfamily lysophospholipase
VTVSISIPGMSLPTPKPADERGRSRGLAYELWLPQGAPPWPGVVVLHGAGSRKENHADFARLARAGGWAALCFDQRGHGSSEGEMSPAVVADAAHMARLLASVEGVDPARVCARGSSMGGFVAIHAAATSPALVGVIAICPAGERQLLSGLRRGELEMRADRTALEPWLEEHDLGEAVALMGAKPLLLMHAAGDDQIPADHSRALFERAEEPRRLIVVPGGHHRSVQHDAELSSIALDWLGRALGPPARQTGAPR